MSDRAKLEDSELSVRAKNCFQQEGLTYWDEVATLTDAELLKIPSFGRKSLNEVRYMLSEKSFKPVPPTPPVVSYDHPRASGLGPLRARNLDIARRRFRGETYDSIASHHKITRERVRQIVFTLERINRAGWSDMSAR